MKPEKFVKAIGAVALLVAIVVAAMLIRSPRVQAGQDGDDDRNGSKIQIGFEIAPVPLNLAGKQRSLVGLGSYIVNAQSDCNGCHSAGPPTEFTASGNPYQLPPVFSGKKQVNPATYLGGGRDFGPYPGPSSLLHIISRNLTPDKTGLAEGGRTFAEFLQIMRTGTDLDHLHPTCTGTPTASCLTFPFNGDLLQIMPWPGLQNLTDQDLQAIYQYLSAIPCIEGPPAPSPLHNDCS